MKKPIRLLLLTGMLFSIMLKLFGQLAPEMDPIASQMVRSESMDRRMADKEIEMDIKMRDNQTAQEISRFRGENNNRLEKSIDEMKRVYSLLNETYNKAEKVMNYQEARDFINRQRNTSSNIVRLLGSLSFSKDMINVDLMQDVIQALLAARQKNREAWEIFQEATKSDNQMTTGERAMQIKQANMRNEESMLYVERALARIHNHDVRNTQLTNSKKLLRLIEIF
jgi:hypothetical protein